jgi:cold shock CspA family protein
MAPKKNASKVKTGVVKSFNEKRGEGLIRAHDDGRDFVVRGGDIDLPGYAVLRAGQFVTFEAPPTGEVAKNVQPTTLA